MLFIRTNDSAKIKSESGFVSFENQKRKGNIVKKFSLDKLKEASDEINYINEKLDTKMIPKNSLNIINHHPIKLILTSNQNILVFQDIDCKANFLTIKDGDVQLKKFEDLNSNDDSVLCYDENADDWYIDDIELLSISYLNDLNNYDEEFKDIELSKYILFSEYGIIINNIFVI